MVQGILRVGFFFKLLLGISPNGWVFPPSRDGWPMKPWTNKLTSIFMRSEKGRRNIILSAKWSHCHLSLSLAGEVSTGKFCRRDLLSHSQDKTCMQCKFSSHSNPGVLSLLTKKSSSGLSCGNVSSGPLGTNSLTQCLRKVTSGVGSGCLGACQLVYPLIPAPETRIRWGLSQAEWVTHPLPHLPSHADLRALFPCIPQRGILCSLHPYEWCGSSKTLLQEHTAISFSI